MVSRITFLQSHVLSLTRKVYGSMNVSSDPASQHLEPPDNHIEETGTELATVLTQSPGWLSSFTRLASIQDKPDLAVVAERRILNVGNHPTFSSLSRTIKTPRVLLSLLYSVNNNLLTDSQAPQVFSEISQGVNRKFFGALIANVSPTTKRIAQLFLPVAIYRVDIPMMKALLATGVNLDFIVPISKSSLLATAINNGNTKIVQLLLKHGATVEVLEYGLADRFDTPLEAAARAGRLDLVKLLLKAGARLDIPGPEHGASVLANAASRGSLVLVQHLIEAGADVRSPIREQGSSKYNEATAMQRAAIRGNTAMAEALLSHGADVNALEYATIGGHLDMVKLLLERGANDAVAALKHVRSRDRKQIFDLLVHSGTPTHGTLHDPFESAVLEAALRCGQLEHLRWFMDADISVSFTPTMLTSTLEAVARNGRLLVAQFLVSRGADVNAPATAHPWLTSLESAVEQRQVHLVEFLLCSGADVNGPAGSMGQVISRAADTNNMEIVRLLLKHGADLARHGASAVAMAVHHASTEMLQFLLQAWALTGNADMSCVVGRDNHTALEMAARCFHVELTQTLLDYKVYTDGDQSLALVKAITCGNLKVARLLLASGADVGYLEREKCWRSDAEGEYYMLATALDKAAEKGKVDLLDLLLQRRTTVDERTRALQVAARCRKFDAAQLLLSYGVNVNAPPLELFRKNRKTALQGAAWSSDPRLLRCLLDAGADVESKVRSLKEQGTALQFASIAGNIGIVTILLQNGADVNASAIGRNGRTAVEGAAEHGRIDTVQLLINMGAERAGSRALNFAREEGHDGVVALLLENGFEQSKSVWSDDYLMNDEVEDGTMDGIDEEAEDDVMGWAEAWEETLGCAYPA
jgi:ankyrin repeat protein